MPRSPRIRPLLATLALLLSSSTAHAQRSGGPVDLQLFRPAVDSKGILTVNGSQVLGHLDLSFGLVLNYANAPLSIRACMAGVSV